jgi:hypothetical protein
MNRVTLASAGFLAFAIAVSVWLLARSPVHAVSQVDIAAANPRAGMTFAEWSVRSDAVLLADIDPGEGMSTIPRRFLVVKVKGEELTDGASFSWAPVERAASAGSLFALGFRVNAEGRAFVPPDDPLYSDPITQLDGGTLQAVALRAKTGRTASFTRRRTGPMSNASWGRRAIAFVSPDGHLAYVTPDAIVIPLGNH